MAITRVQSAIASGTSNNPLLTFGASTTAGNLIVFGLAVDQSLTVTATGWTFVASATGGVNPVHAYFKPATSSISGFGISLSVSAGWVLWAAEYAISSSSPLDQQATAGGVVTSPIQTPTLNTTNAAEAIIYLLVTDGGGTSGSTWSSPSQSFSIANQLRKNSGMSFCAIDRIVSSTGTYNPTINDPGAGGASNIVGISFADIVAPMPAGLLSFCSQP